MFGFVDVVFPLCLLCYMFVTDCGNNILTNFIIVSKCALDIQL